MAFPNIAHLLLASIFAHPAQAGTPSASELLRDIENLQVVGSALYVAAHPDDENTRLLHYLAEQRGLRTAYLSMTRGGGGQNLIGTEQSELLGVVRTGELMAARSVDGALTTVARPSASIVVWVVAEVCLISIHSHGSRGGRRPPSSGAGFTVLQ